MDHEKFQQRLNEVLDNREPLEQDAQLRRMADGDPACAESLWAAQSLMEGVELLDCPTVRPDMADRVLATVSVGRRHARFLRIWVPICVAAALLLSAIPLYQFLQGRGNKTPAIAKPNTVVPERVEPKDAGEPDYLVKTHRAGAVLGEAIWSPSYDHLSPAQQQSVKPATDEISPVADPMANTVAFTVDAVIRTIEPNLPRP